MKLVLQSDEGKLIEVWDHFDTYYDMRDIQSVVDLSQSIQETMENYEEEEVVK